MSETSLVRGGINYNRGHANGGGFIGEFNVLSRGRSGSLNGRPRLNLHRLHNLTVAGRTSEGGASDSKRGLDPWTVVEYDGVHEVVSETLGAVSGSACS